MEATGSNIQLETITSDDVESNSKLSGTKSADSNIGEKKVDSYEDDDFEAYEDDNEDTEAQTKYILNTFQSCDVPKNRTFSQQKMMTIERDNSILMRKILANNRRPNLYKNPPKFQGKTTTSAEVNRKKDQMKINYENQILLKKIQQVKPHVLQSNRPGRF